MKKRFMFLCGIAAMVSLISCDNEIDVGSGEYVESEVYAFSMTFGTMPSLYAGLYAVDREIPTYFFFEREQTFDTDGFPEHVMLCPYLGADEEEKMRDWMKKTITDINDKNPDISGYDIISPNSASSFRIGNTMAFKPLFRQ